MLEWHLLDEDIKGSMEIKCDYELDSRGRMVVSLGGHTLRPDDKMPQDPVELVKILQRAIPHEMFDPNEHAMETKVSLRFPFLRMQIDADGTQTATGTNPPPYPA